MRITTVIVALSAAAAAASPALGQVGACCFFTAQGQPACIEVTALSCANNWNGTFQGVGTACDQPGIACGIGACCFEEAGMPECIIASEAACTNQFAGTWQGLGSTCFDVEIPCVQGACCFEIGGLADCGEHTEEVCAALGGAFQGDGVTCSDPEVPCAFGGCCVGADSCYDSSEADCELAIGVFYGSGITCDDSDFCDDGPSGACCLYASGIGQGPSGCSVLPQDQCSIFGGTYFGIFTTCEDVEVLEGCGPGACCVEGVCVEEKFELICGKMGGVYLGHQAACAGEDCDFGPGCDIGAFNLLGSLDASDNPAVQGENITTDGEFYHHPAGTTNPPPSFFLPFFPGLAYDSYISIDGLNANGNAGPSTDSYTANTAITGMPTVFTANSMQINHAFSMPGIGVQSVFREDLGYQVIFIARLTVKGGSGSISAPQVVVNLELETGGLIALALTTGPENAVEGPGLGSYFILVDQTPVTIPGITEPCSADLDEDGSVGSTDLNIILAHFGEQTPNGDTNGDGFVNSTDLNTVLAEFGFTGECPATLIVNDLYIARSCLPAP